MIFDETTSIEYLNIDSSSLGGSGDDYLDVASVAEIDTRRPLDLPTYGNWDASFRFGSGNDTLIGSQFSEIISGGEGDDSLDAGAGDDLFLAYQGRDTLLGGAGVDTVILESRPESSGGGAVDTSEIFLDATTSVERIDFNAQAFFGAAADELFDFGGVTNYISYVAMDLGGGAYTFVGGAGNDVLTAGGNSRFLDGGDGTDRLTADFSAISNDIVMTHGAPATATDYSLAFSGAPDIRNFEQAFVTLGSGNDQFVVNGNAELSDNIIGGAGDDTIGVGSGDATLDGGDGTDLLVLDFSGLGYNRYNETDTDAGRVRMSRDESSRSESNAATTLSELSFILADNRASNFGESGADREDHIHVTNFEQANIIGSMFNDILTGGELDDTLIGGAGDDGLRGNAGTDQMEGGTGNDTLLAGSGDDSLRGGAGNDSLVGGEGQDTAYFDISSLDAVVSVVDGGVQIVSSLGTDFADASVEMISFSDGVLSFVETIGLSDLLLNGTAGADTLVGAGGNDTLLGEDGWDVLRGDDGDDSLRGGDGNDTLVGGDGDDILIGGESEDDRRDVIYGGAGNDAIDGGYGNDELRGDAGNDTIAGGFGADTVIGGTGDDTLTGAAFGDQIFGGDGGDFINGGFGYDLMNGGAGADRFFHLGIADHGSDWVQDYNAAEGDVLHFGNGAATRNQFQINTTHTATAEGERSGDDNIEEAFVIYRPTGQIMWALVDGAGQSAINLQIGQDVFDLQA